MLNIEKYKDDINLMKFSVNQNTGKLTMSGCPEITRAFGNNQFYVREFLKWLAEEYKEPLLTEDEQEFLKDLKKWYGFDAILVNYTHVQLLSKISDCEKEVSRVTLPALDGDSAFDNLDYARVYTLEELGITYDD